MNIEDCFFVFLTGNERSEWIYTPHLSVYLRKGWHVLASELRQTLDLANVQVHPAHQRTGKLRELLLLMEAQDRYHWLYVENVLSSRLGSILNKHGWTRIIVGSDDRVPSYYKRLR